nr:immunoglobulin light chain junction region [Macaca mulatta]
HCQYNDLVFTF